MFNRYLWLVVFITLLSQNALRAAAPNDNDTTVFAIIGDFGSGDNNEKAVSDMVKSWNPQFIVTVGDNSYDDDEGELLPQNVGAFYGDYIYNPNNLKDSCTTKACLAKHTLFYPVPGNHDHKHDNALGKYLNYFAVQRNYRMVKGNAYLYFLDSGKESDGGFFDVETTNSIKQWTKADTLPYFKLVFFHHPPYSTGHHGCNTGTQIGWDTLGLDAVICGHDHLYERFASKKGKKPLYMVDGSGGDHLDDKVDVGLTCSTDFNVPYINRHEFGAVKAVMTKDKITFYYYTIGDTGRYADMVVIVK